MGLKTYKVGDRPSLAQLGITVETAAALAAAGFAIVPILPTAEMVEEAYYSAMAESALHVWKDMIGAWLKQSKGRDTQPPEDL